MIEAENYHKKKVENLACFGKALKFCLQLLQHLTFLIYFLFIEKMKKFIPKTKNLTDLTSW